MECPVRQAQEASRRLWILSPFLGLHLSLPCCPDPSSPVVPVGTAEGNTRPVVAVSRLSQASPLLAILRTGKACLDVDTRCMLQIEQLLELLTTEILHPSSQAPHGVKSHFIEMFLEELAKVGAEESWVFVEDELSSHWLSPQLTADQNLKFIDPFCRIAARTKE
ncbi:hypothetical protein P7K49_032478 [Saguinus oedipus]|uniref:Uncharacterized protein n=1 Tax=Saguinus oedipus TaxID=9490 RepID=A0ABQ9U091_SAGOE|nr:hypothetical protein P7K49_032478 [Saguinus oedipus]